MTAAAILGLLITIGIPIVLAGLLSAYPVPFLILASAGFLMLGVGAIVHSFTAPFALVGGIAELEGIVLIVAGILFGGMAGGIMAVTESKPRRRKRPDIYGERSQEQH